MNITVREIKGKLDGLIDWYSQGPHGSSERFNDGRLSALHELRDWVRHEEAVPECPDYCDNPAHKSNKAQGPSENGAADPN